MFMDNLQIARQKRAVFADFPQFTAKVNTFVENIEKSRQNRLKLKNMVDIVSKKKKISPTALKYWNNFLDRTKKSYKYADEITSKVALAYLEYYYNSGNGKTYNNAKSYLNGIFKYCLVEANLQVSPFSAIANRLVDADAVENHRNLTDAEINKVMKILDKDVQILTQLSRWTTQRLETCARMTPSMFNFETKVFLIDPSKLKRFKKFVCVPIMPELEQFIKPILARCKNPDLPIAYQVRNCTERTNEAISKHFLLCLKKCNILDDASGKASFHSLRGSAITYFKELGLSSDDLRKITGHTTDKMEETYDRSIKQISRIVKKYHVSQNVSQDTK
jgi:hypothetical protein